MGWRFSKRLTIFPGVTLNLSKGLPSLSIGPRGAKINLGKRGARYTVGVPGTGLSYTHKIFPAATKNPTLANACAAAAQALANGQTQDANTILQPFRKEPDASLGLGVIAMQSQEWKAGAHYFAQALQAGNRLGQVWTSMGVNQFCELRVALGLTAPIESNSRGAFIGQTECQQRNGSLDDAVVELRAFTNLYPNDMVAKTMLADLLMDRNAAGDMQNILSLCAGTMIPSKDNAPLFFIIASAFDATNRRSEAVAISKAVLGSHIPLSHDLHDEFIKLR
jgi:predicted Zn-dependent protease